MQQTPNTTTLIYSSPAVNRLDQHAILENAGFRVRGSRADCPYCEGSARLTVAVHDQVYFCHRCHRGGNIRGLAQAQGFTLPPIRKRLADLAKRCFKQWLSAKSAEMATRERLLYRRFHYAKTCLTFYPRHEHAWEILREWYSEQRRFAEFWELASDRIGRLELYRQWRRSWRHRGIRN
jgi:hypothetical protein